MLNTFFIFPQHDTTARTGRYGHRTRNMAAKLRRGTRLRAAQLLGRKLDEMRARYLPDSRTFVYQDESAESVCGFVSLVENYVAALFVHPDRQGQGIGRRLLQWAAAQYPTLELSGIRRKQTGRTLLPPGRFRNPTGTDRCEYRPQRAAFTASKQAILNHPMSNPRVTYRFTAMPVLQLRPQKTRRDASKR